MAQAPAIAVAGLGRDYGRVRAVDAVDLDVQPGEFFGFLGPNGAGKTTTIRMLCTLLQPSRGEARVAGGDVVENALDVRRKIGVVFQETTLDLDLTAEENLRFCTRLYGLSRRDSKARIDEALQLFGLEERRHARVRSFSGGMRRALDLARGILHRPSILFLDEPTLGLDPGQRRRIWAFLQKLTREHGTTLFLTTHYLEEADPCDRVAIVDHGRIVALGEPAELKRRLGHDRVDVRTDRAEEFVPRLRELTGLEPQRAQHGLSIFVDDASAILPSLLPLTADGAEVGVTRPTLEDVFVDLTGREVSL
ncbi:MAG: ATP-binding cassette domain-containing protein [Actinobacteria bacterium]|nr:ATP-binding cassette domain-containing protein [Actinomycetota bacterium]MBV8396468.1 ATP-binding cassette domain-containing protein [Actinomycetota bacterium]